MRLLQVIVLAALAASGCRTPYADHYLAKKASPENPSSAQVVSGNYYRGDGNGYNIYLTLKRDASYVAEWHGCLGKYGDASGNWRLDGSLITLLPSTETGMMKEHLRTLDVMRFNGDWIFLPTGKEDREFYNEFGVSRFSCFQKKSRMR